MLLRLKLTTGKLFSDPNRARAILILSTLLIAAMVGGAPSDNGH